MKALTLFQVKVPANVYTGRYYDYQVADVQVAAKSAPEAIKIVNANRGIVLERLTYRREYGRRLIPKKNPEKNVFFRDSYYVATGLGPYGAVGAVTLFKDGKWRRVDMETGGQISHIHETPLATK